MYLISFQKNFFIKVMYWDNNFKKYLTIMNGPQFYKMWFPGMKTEKVNSS